MQRLVVILILSIYTLLNTGASLHFHYCKGDLKHVGIGHETKSCCPSHDHEHHDFDGAMLSPNCCSDEDVHLELESDHLRSEVLHFDIAFVDHQQPIAVELFENILSTASGFYSSDSSPPLIKRPLYTLFSSRILYA
ncbi:MAG: HYC_CC_PP family protein [Flavobacteriales bacterium]